MTRYTWGKGLLSCFVLFCFFQHGAILACLQGLVSQWRTEWSTERGDEAES